MKVLNSMTAPLLIAGMALLGTAWGWPRQAAEASRPAGVDQVLDRAYAQALGRARSGAGALRLAALHTDWLDPWLVHTAHYSLRATGQRSYALQLVQAAESMLPIYQALLDPDGRLPREKLRIDVFPTRESYNEFADSYSDDRSSIFGGFFDPSNPNGQVAMYAENNASLDRMYVTHAAAQQYLHYITKGRRLSAGVTQGIGAYMQTFWAYGFFVQQFETLRDADRLMDLGQLLSAPLASYSDRPSDRFCQLGMTFVYLRAFKEETRSTFDGTRLVKSGPFDAYVRKIARGQSLTGDPVNELLTQRAHELNAEIIAFRGWQ